MTLWSDQSCRGTGQMNCPGSQPAPCTQGIDGSGSIYWAGEVTWNWQQRQEGAESSKTWTPAGWETAGSKRELGNRQSSAPCPSPNPEGERAEGSTHLSPEPQALPELTGSFPSPSKSLQRRCLPRLICLKGAIFILKFVNKSHFLRRLCIPFTLHQHCEKTS